MIDFKVDTNSLALIFCALDWRIGYHDICAGIDFLDGTGENGFRKALEVLVSVDARLGVQEIQRLSQAFQGEVYTANLGEGPQ